MSKVKLCGLTRLKDIFAVNELLPDYVGYVFAESRRQIAREQADVFSQHLDKRITSVGVFVNQPIGLIAEYLQSGLIQAAQLHGQETEEDIGRLKAETGKIIIRAVSVTMPDDVLRWQESKADYLLFDHGKGGTGERFSWELLKPAAQLKPYFLAGGLNKDNIAAALGYHPYAVDLSSGAETKGVKDPDKMKQLVSLVRSYR